MKFTPSPFAPPRVACDARASVLGLRGQKCVQLSASAIGAVGSTRVTDLKMTPDEARRLAIRLLEEADVVEAEGPIQYPSPAWMRATSGVLVADELSSKKRTA